jgi:hypothetical protein
MSRPSGRWLRRLAWIALVVVAVNLAANLVAKLANRRRARPAAPEPTPISHDLADRGAPTPLAAKTSPEAAAVDAPPEPPAPPKPPPSAPPEPADGEPEPAAWVAPIDKACPDGYPVKAKVASGVYHVPGGLSYTRTVPDRCYASPEQAEADGFRPAKR